MTLEDDPGEVIGQAKRWELSQGSRGSQKQREKFEEGTLCNKQTNEAENIFSLKKMIREVCRK